VRPGSRSETKNGSTLAKIILASVGVIVTAAFLVSADAYGEQSLMISDLAFGVAEAEGFRFEATRIVCLELSLRMSTDCSTLSPRKSDRGELDLMKWRGNVQEFVADGVLVPYINNAEEARDHPPTYAQT
jgi:hypothetical protein